MRYNKLLCNKRMRKISKNLLVIQKNRIFLQRLSILRITFNVIYLMNMSIIY